MKIGILQCGHAPSQIMSEQGDYSDMFEVFLAKSGFSFQTFDVVDMIFPEAVEQADGWLITGSKHGAYEDLPFIPPLEDFIRQIYATGRPMVGVCFGHQIVAQALGGKVEKFQGGWGIGRHDYTTPDGPLTLNAWHQDQVVEKPLDAEVYAGNDFCANAALSYGQRAFTIQPHPEFNADVIECLIDYRGLGIIPENQLQEARDGLPKPVDNPFMAQKITQFFRDAQTVTDTPL
ncbi:type 1 glutamine amidotransferase [Algirhabdus cladophorae]|uniref:type 1 glutamine amidotransferase n=1 Tax=Algirhabdus cladophorae TaxID=3377108 RepID=UPI003B847858